LLKKFCKNILAKYLAYKSNSQIDFGCDLNFKTYLEGNNKLYKNVSFSNSRIGFGTYIGKNSYLVNSSIGRYCSIAENVKIIVGNHPTSNFVSTHPAFFSSRKQAGFSYVKESIYAENNFVESDSNFSLCVGNDVWIGADVKILEGVTIGDGVIVATGAVVIHDLEPYTIYGGVPAKNIKTRFTNEEIEFLNDIKWWEKGEPWLKENINLFPDVKKMKEHYDY